MAKVCASAAAAPAAQDGMRSKDVASKGGEGVRGKDVASKGVEGVRGEGVRGTDISPAAPLGSSIGAAIGSRDKGAAANGISAADANDTGFTAQFTCFTSTQVQMLKPQQLRQRASAQQRRALGLTATCPVTEAKKNIPNTSYRL